MLFNLFVAIIITGFSETKVTHTLIAKLSGNSYLSESTPLKIVELRQVFRKLAIVKEELT